MGKALDAFEALTKRNAPPIPARPEQVIEDDNAVVRTKPDGQIVIERGQTQRVVDRSSESLID